MACTARFAEAWEFSSFFCISSMLTGTDNGGGAGVAYLTDTTIDFIASGVLPVVGMVLYNTTAGTSGRVTAATDTTLTATGVTWSSGNAYRIALLTGVEVSTVEHYLNIAAGDLHAVMGASDQCSCTLAVWATNFLKKLNIIDAASYYVCPCASPPITDAQRQNWLTWMNAQLEAIRKGEIELCSGETGADWPAMTWADQGVTEFASARIISNDMDRNI